MSRANGYVGKGIPPAEATRFTRGRGRYLNDLKVPVGGHVAFVRSPYAHARLVSVDASAARAHPGAIAVFTAADLEPVIPGQYWGGGFRWEGGHSTHYFPLARDKVRFVGEPIACVVATSRYVAEDVAELVDVDYEPLPAVVDAEGALHEPPALLYEEWGDNVYFHDKFAAGDVEAVFAKSKVLRRRFKTQRHTGAPLETRGIIADWDRDSQLLRVYWNHQDVFLARTILAQLFKLPPAQIHVISPDSGGGFGVKLGIYPDEVACCAASILLERPVKWVQDRREDLTGTTQARDMLADIECAHDSEGRVLAIRGRYISDGGAYGLPARGNAVEGMMVGQDLLGPYDIRNYSYELNVVMTNKPPLSVYRGVGQPVSIFIMERLMDDIAGAVGVDRAEVRRRNLVKRDQFPYRSVTGYVYEPGSYEETLDRALTLIEYERFPAYQEQMRREGRVVGLGLAVSNEAVARGAAWYGKRGVPVSGQEGCSMKIDPTGRVWAQLGTTSQGQGIETALRQLIADELTIDIADVRVTMGDTAGPYGAGSWASRQATLGGSAAARAAALLRDKLRKIAALKLECSPDDLDLGEGRLWVKGSASRGMSIAEIANVAYFTASDLPREIEPTLEVVSHFDPPDATFANAAHAAIIEIDTATGALIFHKYIVVHDCGVVINPLIVEGQTYGSVAQGIGGTIYEHAIYSEDGQPLATTFMDYLLPTALDVPGLVIEHVETPSQLTARGVKGVGESGTCFAPATIATGVADALGVPVDCLKLGPNDIFELLRQRLKLKTTVA